MSDVIFDIATMGTSLTAGSGASRSFHSDLEAALMPGKSRKIRTYNHGIPGGYTTDGIARVAATVAMRAKVILVEFSMNDCLKTMAAAQADAINLLNSLKASSPSSAIFLMTMNPVVGSSSSATIRANLPSYYQLYRDLALSQNVGLIDSYPRWYGVDLTEIPDGVHPTPSANKVRLIPAIAEALAGLIA
jgi:lysophospholipase L1-like esterase